MTINLENTFLQKKKEKGVEFFMQLLLQLHLWEDTTWP